MSALDHEPPEDLVERVAAATALRRLAHSLVVHEVDDAMLVEVAAQAARITAAVESGPRRIRREEMLARSRLGDALADDPPGWIVPEGAEVDLFPDSPVSGSANPLGMGLRIRRVGDEAVGTVELGPGWEGAPGRGHGGVVAALVDETIGGLLPIIATLAFTGELTIRYRGPCPLGAPLEFRARLKERLGRKLYIECEGRGPDGLFVESTGVFIAVDLAQLVGLPADDGSEAAEATR